MKKIMMIVLVSVLSLSFGAYACTEGCDSEERTVGSCYPDPDAGAELDPATGKPIDVKEE
jgi:hypothetical protein